jgi:hypothetical protein
MDKEKKKTFDDRSDGLHWFMVFNATFNNISVISLKDLNNENNYIALFHSF